VSIYVEFIASSIDAHGEVGKPDRNVLLMAAGLRNFVLLKQVA
jgi:hypothetical protein